MKFSTLILIVFATGSATTSTPNPDTAPSVNIDWSAVLAPDNLVANEELSKKMSEAKDEAVTRLNSLSTATLELFKTVQDDFPSYKEEAFEKLSEAGAQAMDSISSISDKTHGFWTTVQHGFSAFNDHPLTQQSLSALNTAMEEAIRIDYAQLAEEIKIWIQAHPYQTAFLIVNGVVFLHPDLFSKPVLWALGYSMSGPRAASLASVAQSMVGNIPAKSLLAYLKSAGAGGYGLPVVNGVTQAGAMVVDGMGIWMAKLQEENKQEGECKEKIIKAKL